MRLTRPLAGLLFVAAGILACGNETTTPPAPVPTSIEPSTTNVSLNALGASQQVTATVRDQNDQPIAGLALTFVSADPAVASVSGSGLVTAEGNGNTTVTVSHGSVFFPVTVGVSQVVTQLTKTGGDQQNGQVATQLATAIDVELRDSRGNPVPGGVVPNATVQFAAANGGSVTDFMVTANAAGRASTTWTLGTGAGTQQVDVSLVGGTATTQFSATGTAAAADTVVLFSGNSQTAPNSTALPDSLVVRVEDQYGNGVPGHQVGFSVTSGGGSVSPATANTGANGRAATRWTLGVSLGTQTADAATSPGVPGSPVGFTATATNLSLLAIAPDTLVEGATATLAGTGFDATPANNSVTIDGVTATVTLASPTSLTVTVPSFSCQPARSVSVQVTVGAGNTNPLSHPLNPASMVNLAVGQQQIILDPANFCLQFAATASSQVYLVGLQSLSEVPSNLTATRVIAATGFPSPAPPSPVVQGLAAGGSGLAPVFSPRQTRWLRHRQAEARLQAETEGFLAGLGARATGYVRAPAAAAGFVDSTVAIGDTLTAIRVYNGGGTCGSFDPITTVVRAKGLRSIWLEDVANPLNGYTLADLDSLSKYFDNIIFATDTSYFGSPGDRDGNRRIVVVVTKEVNQRDTRLLGFVLNCDFSPRSANPASNDGEFFYAKAPDPTGTFGSVYSRTSAFDDAPFLIAHEFTHIIQFARRIPISGAFTSWLFEGQATFAEEVNGFAVAGRTTGQNYGFAVAFNTPVSTPIDWHSGAFTDLAFYYGFESSSTRKTAAPHECTWIGRNPEEGNNGPCSGGRDVYGVPWSFYRWVSDQFGSGFGGGEQGLMKAVIGNPAGGFANIAGTVGVSIDTLLAQWAAALYVDDRVLGATARLTIPSWNLVDVESGLFATARLTPIEVLFSTFDQARNVRAGSNAYFRISGTSRPATAVRARSSTDAQLAEPMTMWIVRLQ
jgi:hypothetical protein